MSVVSDAAEALLGALRGVEGVRAYQDVGGQIAPPAAVLGPPTLAWETVCADPTSATFRVAIVVPTNERAMERLWDLVPLVAEAIDSLPDAAVTQATPGSFSSGGSDLPAYDLTVEVSL